MKTTEKATSPSDFNSYVLSAENWLNLYFGQKAPQLPANVKEFIVKYGPYISLIFIVLSLPALLFTFGLGALLAPFAFMGGVRSGFSFSFGSIFALASLVLEAIALPGLFKRSYSKGWKFMFYGSVVSLLESLFSFNLGSLVIGGAISFYFLFQIRSLYKD